MDKEFCTYEQAMALKELGFDEPCLASYYTDIDENNLEGKHDYRKKFNGLEYHPLDKWGTSWEPNFIRNTELVYYVSAPTFSQAFRFFREKHNIQGYIYSSTVRGNAEKTKQFTGYIWNIKGIDTPFLSTDARDELHDTYEEAESACLDKLIEICKNKTNE